MSDQPAELDVSKVPLEDLVHIHNQVLKQIATRAKLNLAETVSAGHDSHGSNHSNNKITDRFLQQQIDQIVSRRQQQ